MKRIVRKVLITILFLILGVFVLALALAFLPRKPISNHVGIAPDEAAVMRMNFSGSHHQFITSDGETLFIRRWNPDSLESGNADIAVLIFHGVTAHSGAYDMVGRPLSAGGYTIFGVDYRGHGLSGGNRGDYPSKERWIADLSETVNFLKELGYSRVIILGHSLGVASAIYTTKSIPNEISGLILLSGAYEGRKGVSRDISMYEKVRILASSFFRPSIPAFEYYREGMTGSDDPLFNFKYTLRFLTMLDMKELILPDDLNIPVLVGVGDKDELFEINKVRELYNVVPGNQKEFLIMKDAYHARFPEESWDNLVLWLDNNF